MWGEDGRLEDIRNKTGSSSIMDRVSPDAPLKGTAIFLDRDLACEILRTLL
jgi:hypothetical protein